MFVLLKLNILFFVISPRQALPVHTVSPLVLKFTEGTRINFSLLVCLWARGQVMAQSWKAQRRRSSISLVSGCSVCTVRLWPLYCSALHLLSLHVLIKVQSHGTQHRPVPSAAFYNSGQGCRDV